MQKQKIISLGLDILIFSLYALILYYILSNNVIFDLDDINSTIKSYPLWREENGRYICNFISRIFGNYIPSVTNWHLQDYISTAGTFLYILIIISLIKISSSFAFITGKNRLISSLCIIPVLFIFSSYFLTALPNYKYIYSFQYGYVLATVLGFGFLYFLINFLINKELPKNNTKNIILFTALGFSAGNSSQIVTASIMVVIFLSAVICLNNYKEFFKQKILKYPIISFICGFALMVLCPGFWIEVSWRHANSANDIISNFIPFVKDLFKVIYLNHIILIKFIILVYILIIISCFIKKNLKQNIKFLLISILPIIGVYCYYFTLILGGRTFPSEPLGFWTQEPFYQYYYLMVISLTISLLLGFLSSQIKNNHIKYTIVFIFIGLLINNYRYIMSPQLIVDQKQQLKQIRQTIYECDKIVLSQYYKGVKEITAPNYCIQNPITIYSHPENKYYNLFYNTQQFQIKYIDDIPKNEQAIKKRKFKNLKRELNENDNNTADIQ